VIGGRSAAFARDALIIRCSSHLLTKYAFEYSSTSSGRSRSTALVKSRRMGWSSSGTLMSIAARSPGLTHAGAVSRRSGAVPQRRKRLSDGLPPLLQEQAKRFLERFALASCIDP
jgi:hypothetical protein